MNLNNNNVQKTENMQYFTIAAVGGLFITALFAAMKTNDIQLTVFVAIIGTVAVGCTVKSAVNQIQAARNQYLRKGLPTSSLDNVV